MKHLGFVLLALFLAGTLVFKYVPMYRVIVAFDGMTDAEEVDEPLQIEVIDATQLPITNEGTYLYEKEGFGGDFTIKLKETPPEEFLQEFADQWGVSFDYVPADASILFESDPNTAVCIGEFEYCEGALSSYLGMGTYEEFGDGTVVLTENSETCLGRVYRFRRHDGTAILITKEDGTTVFGMEPEYLEFISEGSDAFSYTQVQDGDRFYSTKVGPFDFTLDELIGNASE